MFTAGGVISLRASLSAPVLRLIRSVISVQLVTLYSDSAVVRWNREFDCHLKEKKIKILMVSDSGKVLLMKTVESRASGIPSFILVRPFFCCLDFLLERYILPNVFTEYYYPRVDTKEISVILKISVIRSAPYE